MSLIDYSLLINLHITAISANQIFKNNMKMIHVNVSEY